MKHTLLLVLLVAVASMPARAQPASLVIENGRVIVGDGTVIEGGYVALNGDRIMAVSSEPVDADGARRIDAAGKTVLPGLIDTHVHLLMEALFAQPRSDDSMRAFLDDRLPHRLRAYTNAGITTVMSTGDFWPFIGEVRESIRSGRTVGPRVHMSGRIATAINGHPAATFCGFLDVNGPNAWCREHITDEVATTQEARTAVTGAASDGADVIKIVYDGTSGPNVGVLTPDLMEALVGGAHEQDLRAYGHILEHARAITAIRAGLDGLVHIPAVVAEESEPQQLVQLMQAERVAASSTLTTFDEMAQIAGAQGNEEQEAMMHGYLDGMRRTLGRLLEQDPALIAVGTDAPHLPPAEAYHREIELLSEVGLTPEQIIAAATRNAAVHIGLDNELGTLESGKLADIVVVNGNPLSELAALRDVVLVVKGGEIVAPK